ncbi:MAG: MBL fold metallo-hydrolase [Oscillospiraceae bacterium]|nr:MBL fold metallo-hydrolase [Oscillospiraceae bacterium]
MKYTPRKYIRNRNKIGYSGIALVLLLGFALYIFASRENNIFNPFSGYDTEVTAHFIDVGQGDSTLLIAKDRNILVDGGERNRGGDVAEYLQKHGVKSLDLVVVTHYHTDHYGGLITILESFPVTEILLPNVKDSIMPDNKTFGNFMDVIENKKENENLIVTLAEKGLTRDFGDGKLTVVDQFADSNDINNTSAIVKFTYKTASFLMAGDIEDKTEKRLLDEGTDIFAHVVKLNHHGSRTSNSEEFLKRTQAKAYVISCGSGNSYKHPHKEVLEILDSMQVQYYRTDINGTVVFATDGGEDDSLAVNLEREARSGNNTAKSEREKDAVSVLTGDADKKAA